MAQIDTAIEIAAPPEVVFVFFVPQRMPYWYGREMQACFEVPGGASDFAVAQKIRITGHMGDREISHIAVVTAMRRPALFEWRFEDRYGVKGLERWELQRRELQRDSDAPAPRTLVTMRSEYTIPGFFGKAVDWLVTHRAIARRNRDYLKRLKRLVDHTDEGIGR
jgi:Polyketide cyclase / dehydrase and lipid transport